MTTDVIEAIPFTPLSHPLIERLIGTIRREFLDQTLFWNAHDLAQKLEVFCHYYNTHRVHTALDGETPSGISDETTNYRANLCNFRWNSHCHGLYNLPVAPEQQFAIHRH